MRKETAQAAEYIKRILAKDSFDITIIGGSGIELGSSIRTIPYDEIPEMPKPAVPGHKGQLHYFRFGRNHTLFFEGRFHYYEGRSDSEIRFIPELSSLLGVKLMILTCASGAVSRKATQLEIGVVIDHINLLGRNPLVGLLKDYGTKVFLNAKNLYDRSISKKLLQTGLELGISTGEVTLAATLGPNYETFSEIKLLELAGADCVSMSTIPEALAAAFFGMKVTALTVITNDTLNPEASHEEVLEISKIRTKKLSSLIKTTVENLDLITE